jgi:selenocysteine lyase/cysteine desulfurase
VNGIREFALAKGAAVTYIPVVPPDLRTDEGDLLAALDAESPGGARLFAYPAQSNFSGVRHPLDWIDLAHARGWDVLLDAAAFAATNRLDLSRWKPDYVDLSFYKMFGYPTGIGCLIARKAALAKLRRPWYAGGTVAIASVEPHHPHGGDHYLYPGVAAFEDGTVNYLGIPAVEIGLRYLEGIGIETIHRRVECLTGWLLQSLLALRHRNGKPLLRIHGPTTTEARGGTISMNFRDPEDRILNSRYVEARANERSISVRVGCHCNPGAGEVALGFTEEQIHRYFLDRERMSREEFLEFIDERKSGAVRISLGLATTFADVYRFVAFAKTFLDRPAPVVYVVADTAPGS